MVLMATNARTIILIVVVTVVIIAIATTARYRLTGSALPRAFGGGTPPSEPEKETESWKQ